MDGCDLGGTSCENCRPDSCTDGPACCSPYVFKHGCGGVAVLVTSFSNLKIFLVKVLQVVKLYAG